MQMLLDNMYEKLDANHDGIVVWEEFIDYFLLYVFKCTEFPTLDHSKKLETGRAHPRAHHKVVP